MKSFYTALVLAMMLLLMGGCNNGGGSSSNPNIVTIGGINFDTNKSAALSDHWLQLPTEGTIKLFTPSTDKTRTYAISTVTVNGVPGIEWYKEDLPSAETGTTVYAMATDGAVYIIKYNDTVLDPPLQFVSANQADYTPEKSYSDIPDCILIVTPPNAYGMPSQYAYFQIGIGIVESYVITYSGGLAFSDWYVVTSNFVPVAEPQSLLTTMDTNLSITLSGSDLDEGNLSYALMTQPTHGTLSGTAPNLTYTPTAGYLGSDSFSFRVNDGIVDSAPAIVGIGIVDQINPGTFVISVNTDTLGTSSDTQFEIPTMGGGYNYRVDCDSDGNYEATGQTGNYVCNYAAPGTYTVSIEGYFPRIYFNNEKDRQKILSVDQWGTGTWSSMESAFNGCSQMVLNATDTPDLSGVSNMSKMFAYAYSFNQDISSWNVSSVTDMSNMFKGASAFNQDISSWNVSNVTTMRSMFERALAFNQSIGTWDVGNVTDMSSMFENIYSFNMDIGNWNVGSVTNMSRMFYNSDAFNQDIGGWNVSSVTDMHLMFTNTYSFNQNIGGWDVSSVTNMNGMFASATAFNQPVGNWNVSSVTDMGSIFAFAYDFNQSIGTWDVSNVTDMSSMFRSSSFNHDISGWNVSSVTNMSGMFESSAFNQNIGGWDVSSVTDMSSMFYYSYAFNQDISSWNVSSVTDMNQMFFYSSAFNQDIGSWNVSNVTDMGSIFAYAYDFNQSIGTWDVSSVTDMSSMFTSTVFNHDIGGWNVSSVTDMSHMFESSAFNQDIGTWDVSSVTDMSHMFESSAFNQDIGTWDVSSVTDMNRMFCYAMAFNQNIASWNVSSVTDMIQMFFYSTAFNQDIGSWNVSSVKYMDLMFTSSAFNQDISAWNISSVTGMYGMLNGVSLSTPNYDALLTGWGAQTLQPGVYFDGGNSQYSAGAAATARQSIIDNYGWIITDGGQL